MPVSSSNNSAVQRALRLPEIAALIVDVIDQDVHARHSLDHDIVGFADFIKDNQAHMFELKRTALGPLACLNHMWFELAVPRLWRQTCITRSDPSLTTIFLRISPERRNMYAQYIEIGGIEMVTVDRNPYQQDKEMFPDSMLSNVNFPRLRHLIIRHPGHSGYSLPRLGPQRVEAILIHASSYETTFRDKPIVVADMERILDLIPEIFPHLQQLTPSTLYLGEMNPIYLRRFEETMRKKRQSEPDNSTPLFKVHFDRRLPEANKPDTLHGCFLSLAGQDSAFALASYV
ncbi:hypothetical protein PG993_000095 [Apiospora rasikravindrae]|uniref:Uncharacterized protein n=1 Tax=Apiospora rasikravindrae TaxID=990691 RepID=A0ABR1U7J0_9PEZI